MLERIYKTLLTIVILPFLLLIITCIMLWILTLPFIVFIKPDVIKFGE